MALVWQMYRLQVNLPNFSSCFSNFIKSFINIFDTLVEYMLFAVRSILQTVLRLMNLPECQMQETVPD